MNCNYDKNTSNLLIFPGKSRFFGKVRGDKKKQRSFLDSEDQNISEYFYFVPRKNLTVAKTPKMHGIFHILVYEGALQKNLFRPLGAKRRNLNWHHFKL